MGGIILSSKNTRWDASKVKVMFWQGLLDYARIAWEKTLNDSKRETTSDDVIAKFDAIWGGNDLLYHRWHCETTRNNWTPNVGLANHSEVVHPSWGLCGSIIRCTH